MFGLELLEPGKEQRRLLVYQHGEGTTIDALKQYENIEGVRIVYFECTEDFYVELFRDVFPAMRNLRRISILDRNITLKVHQLCAALVCTSSTLQYVNVKACPVLDSTSIEVVYIRALRHQPRFYQPMNLFVHFQSEEGAHGSFTRFQELANQTRPTMLERCHEALCQRLAEGGAEN